MKRFLFSALPLLVLTMALSRLALEALGIAPSPAVLSWWVLYTLCGLLPGGLAQGSGLRP